MSPCNQAFSMADKPPSRKQLRLSHGCFHDHAPRLVAFPDHRSSSLRSSESGLSPIFNHHSMPTSPASTSGFWNAASVAASGQEFGDRFEDQLFPGVPSVSDFSQYHQNSPSQSSLFLTDQVAAESICTSRIPETHPTLRQSILTPISGLSDIDVGFESAFSPTRKWAQEVSTTVGDASDISMPSKLNPSYTLHQADVTRDGLPSSFQGFDKQEKPWDFGSSPPPEVRNLTSAGALAAGGSVEAPSTPNSSMSSSSSEHHEDCSSHGGAAGPSAETTGDKPDEENDLVGGPDQKPSVEAAKKPAKPRRKGQKRIREPRIALVTKSDVEHLEDGYRWRKYGQKAVKNSPHPRSYYRCTHAKCSVKKRVERCLEDASLVVTTYEGQHTHHSPAVLRRSAEAMPQISFGEIPTSHLASCLLNLPHAHPYSSLHPSLSIPYSFSGPTNFDVNRNLQASAAPFRSLQLMPECLPHRLHNAIASTRPGAGTVPGAVIQPPVDEGLLDDMFPSAVRKPS